MEDDLHPLDLVAMPLKVNTLDKEEAAFHFCFSEKSLASFVRLP